jgi:hypothetical protein
MRVNALASASKFDVVTKIVSALGYPTATGISGIGGSTQRQAAGDDVGCCGQITMGAVEFVFGA